MAWTQVGGEVLETEAAAVKGKGNLLLTGQLGDVMKESAEAGMTYIRSRADELGLAPDFYATTDISTCRKEPFPKMDRRRASRWLRLSLLLLQVAKYIMILL